MRQAARTIYESQANRYLPSVHSQLLAHVLSVLMIVLRIGVMFRNFSVSIGLTLVKLTPEGGCFVSDLSKMFTAIMPVTLTHHGCYQKLQIRLVQVLA